MNFAQPNRPDSSNPSLDEYPIGLVEVLFAVLQDFVSTTKSTSGYIEIANDQKNNQLSLKRLSQVNTKQLSSIRLVDIFYRLAQVTSSHLKSMHVDKIINNVTSKSKIRFTEPESKYSSTLLSTDEDILSWCIIAIVSACNTSTLLQAKTRKSGKYLVLSITTRKKNWLTPRVSNIISRFKIDTTINRKQHLDELLVSYALTMLSTIDVKISTKKTNEHDNLYLLLPISQQLNVFDGSGNLG